MKILILTMLIFLPSPVFAISGDIVLKESLENSEGVTFGTAWELCTEYPNGRQKCAEHIDCRKVSFTKVVGTEHIFARIVQDNTLYSFYQADITKSISKGFCSGEPNTAQLIFYRQTQKGYVELNTYGGSPCYLSIGRSYEYRERLIVKTVCRRQVQEHSLQRGFMKCVMATYSTYRRINYIPTKCHINYLGIEKLQLRIIALG
jgi:hypothetical protein